MTAEKLYTAAEVIGRIAEVATAVGWQSGTGASEAAGLIVSCLSAAPEQTDRFMVEGSELFIDGTITFKNGALTYHAMSGEVLSPSVLRKARGSEQ